MGLFKKFKTLPIPEECAGMSIKIESSICTGEKTIGFYDPKEKRLMYTELVRTDEDIDAFYAKYGIKKN